MRRAWGLIATAALMLLSHSAWGIVRRDDVADDDYINLANLPQFAAVGKVQINNTGVGSGTVIANGWWVLTAAHVVNGAPVNSISFQIGAATYTVRNVYIYPGYSGTTHDIALIALNAPVAGVTPALIYTGTNESNQQGHSVGYGATGTGQTGYQNNTYGTKRAMRNIIDLIISPNGTIDPNGSILLSDFDSPGGGNNSLGLATPLDLEGMGAPGDSGGPVFILEGGVWYIAGVHSFIGDPGPPAGNGQADARYGDILGSTRVSSYAGWINSTVPEPASMTALAVGLVGLLARRRRNR